MSDVTVRRPRRRDRLRHRRQQPRVPPHPARLDGRRPDRQGAAAEPGRLHGARLELHLPGRPLEGDDAAHARVAAPVRRAWTSTPSAAASRWRAPRSGWRSCGGGWRRRSRGASTRRGSSRRPRSRSSSRTSTSRSCSAASTARPSRSSTRCAPGTIMRERAIESGALTVFPNTEVSGMDVEHGRIRRVHTSRGTIEAETVVIACGVWSPLLARDGGRAHPAHADGAPDDRRRARCRASRRARARSSSRSCATWTCSCTSARTGRASRSARTRTARSSTTPRRSPRSRRRRSRRPSSRSRRRTSTPRWRTRST